MSKAGVDNEEGDGFDVDVRFSRALREGGFTGFLMLDRETAQKVLTDERLRILDALDEHEDELESKTDLAGILDREVSAVHRDLDLLFENSLVRYEEDAHRRIPRLAYEHIVVEPIR